MSTSTPADSSLPYRPNVCLLVHNQQNLWFVGERLKDAGHWQLPQGGIESDQSVEEAAIREAVEELGTAEQFLTLKRILPISHRYDWKEPPSYAKGKFRGQEQQFAVVSFSGTDADIDLGAYHTPEFANFMWKSASEILELVPEFRRIGYRKAFAAL